MKRKDRFVPFATAILAVLATNTYSLGLRLALLGVINALLLYLVVRAWSALRRVGSAMTVGIAVAWLVAMYGGLGFPYWSDPLVSTVVIVIVASALVLFFIGLLRLWPDQPGGCARSE